MLSPVLVFWFACSVTRPLGASFADWMGVPPAGGGLDIGTGTVSLVLLVLIAAFVGYLTINGRDAGRGDPVATPSRLPARQRRGGLGAGTD